MERLKKTQDFSRGYRRGKSKADRNLVLYLLKNDLEESRLGISVSKKVGNSVVRHCIKRRVREAVRLHEEQFPTGYDIIVIARKPAAEADYHQLETSVLNLNTRFGKDNPCSEIS
jgi:ribonuclease P protein component